MVILVVSMLRGGKGFTSLIGIEYCSSTSFAILLVGQLTCMSIAILITVKDKLNFESRSITIDVNDQQLAMQKQATEGNSIESIEISDRFSAKMKPMISAFCKIYFGGMLSGMIGIGGGVIVNPTILNLGYPPEIAATISGFVVLFTSLSTSTQFLIAGAYDLHNSFYIFLFSMVGSYFGKMYIDRLIRKWGRPSMLVWILFGLTVLSAIILPGVGVYKMFLEKSPFKFGSICT